MDESYVGGGGKKAKYTITLYKISGFICCEHRAGNDVSVELKCELN